MIGDQDQYYGRTEVSNSDLGWLDKYFLPSSQVYDIASAYRFGNLIDAMITEPHRCNHYTYKVDSEQFTKEEWQQAYKMLDAFRKDEICQHYLKLATGQNVMSKEMEFMEAGLQFKMNVRCKWDLWMPVLKHGADIKSTTATTQRQFEQSLQYFNYDRQRAFYMDIAGADKDLLIGISKINFRIFKVPIVRDGAIYQSGKEKYTQAAFKYWYLFENF